jgi:glycosyltransferase involved in cell wall biosynthesis
MGHESSREAVNDPSIIVIIPCRSTDSPEITLGSLAKQTCRDFSAHVVMDYPHKGAPWARNFGLQQCPKSSPYVLFSDADIRWEPTALEAMTDTLVKAQHDEQYAAPASMKQPWMTGYAYGGYYLQEQTMFDDKFKTFRGPIGNEPWNYETLLQRNFVSTMSLIRRDALNCLGPVPWDERLRRLQDWDVWLGLATQGWRGVWTGDVTFTTKIRPGISFQSEHRDEHTGDEQGVSYNEACHIVRAKHGLS